MTRALIIGKKEQDKIDRLIKHAHKEKVSFKILKKMARGKIRPVGDDYNYRIFLPIGFKVVFSIEEQPAGWFRHLSVSVDSTEKYPNEHAVEAIMYEFGFQGTLRNFKDGVVYLEKEVRAVNIVQKIGGDDVKRYNG